MAEWFRRGVRGRRRGRGSKPKVLYLVKNYPQLSQTYIKTEIAALCDDYDVAIVASSIPNLIDPEHRPYHHIPDVDDIVGFVAELDPAIIHGHYLVQAPLIAEVANRTATPFTVRAHSFDAMGPEGEHAPSHIRELGALTASDLCLGVLTFPFRRDYLIETGGVAPGKLVDAPPVVDFHHFHDRSCNGTAVMNTGACIPKKKMEEFVTLAARVPGHDFNLYAMGHRIAEMRTMAAEIQSPVDIKEPVPYSAMPQVYKRHGWLVYTACERLRTVGWPMAIAEAQAAGVVVCMANIRPDLDDYLAGTGHLYDNPDDVVEILGSPPDPQLRDAGFDNARRHDITDNLHLLTDLWEPHLR